MKQIVLLLFFLVGLSVQSQELVYTPRNPNFGGDTFNYQWLLSSAEAQNSFKDPEGEMGPLSELDRFKESLNTQMLGNITRSMFTEQFGEDGLSPGSYVYGNLALDIYDSNEGLVINILDTNTGETTQIIIPN